jgi:PAS domain S-box-containing protein
MKIAQRDLTSHPSFWLAVFALISRAILAGGLAYSRYEMNLIRREEYRNLAVIAEMKARLITEWREERLLHVAKASHDPFLRKAIADFIKAPGNPDLASDLRKKFELEQKGFDLEQKGLAYADVLLIDPDGKTLLSVPPKQADLFPIEKEAIENAIVSRQAVLSDLFRVPGGDEVRMDAVAPVLADHDRPLAVLVGRIIANTTLYPLCRFWPTPSRTAETILVKVEGGEVLVLNDLRHGENTALSTRYPLNRTELPAVQAAMGKTGIFEGRDYRNIEVLADLRPVPGSPWFMVAQVDRGEILAEATYRATITGFLVAISILLTASVIAFIYRHREIELLKALYQSEREQRQAVEVFRITLYGIGDAVITTDKAGLISHMNRMAEKLTGWEESEAKGRPVEEVFKIIGEELRITVENPVRRVLNERTVVELAGHTLLVGRDGLDRPVADSGAPIRDDSGAIVGVVLVFRDQTQERAAHRSLEESEERFRKLVENAPDAIFVEVDGVFAYLNPVAVKLFGADSQNELLHRPVLERCHSAFHEQVKERLRLLNVETKQVSPLEEKYIRLDGTLIDVEVSAVPTTYKDRQGALVFARDIRERKGIEQEREKFEAQLFQAQKLEALGVLAGGIAHDFNNILGIISGYTEMAQWGAAKGSQVWENLQEARVGIGRAAELVQQILAFSSSRSRERKPFQVALVVKEALKMLRATLPSTIEIKEDVASNAAVLGDPTQIHQVMMNLCTNAAHAMQDGGGLLAVSLTDVRLGPEAVRPHSGLQPGPYVKLAVQDTGHGIDSSILDRIFDPFFTTKGPGVGTGLGLAVVHGIVHSHGGAIEVDSPPGRGTIFQVLLPAMKSAPEPETVEAEPLPRGRERILVVDDEPALALVTKQMLERLGYGVEYRTNGIDALDAFRHQSGDNSFDLVITDMTMPHLTGVDLAGQLHQLKPDLPIILCTGFSDQVDAEKAKGLGIQGCLLKPVVMKDLAHLVRNALDGKKNNGEESG